MQVDYHLVVAQQIQPRPVLVIQVRVIQAIVKQVRF